jgi:hypothetical protein
MTQLNVRVSDGFAEKIRTFSKREKLDLGALVESVCTQAIEEAEADKRFEDESVEAWQIYMESGISVEQGQIKARFEAALAKARQVAAKGAACEK